MRATKDAVSCNLARELYGNDAAIASGGCKAANEIAVCGAASTSKSRCAIANTAGSYRSILECAKAGQARHQQRRTAMYDNPRSLLDEIALVHGPREVLGRYFAIADAMARNCGVRLRLRTDFDALMDLNRANRATWPPLPPICDPSYSTLGADNAFWLDGVNDHGETVVTYFARLFDFVDTNLVEAIRSLRIYYDDPTPHAAAGEMVEIDAPSAAVVCGRTV